MKSYYNFKIIFQKLEGGVKEKGKEGLGGGREGKDCYQCLGRRKTARGNLKILT